VEQDDLGELGHARIMARTRQLGGAT
jgi:hypothetical protein